MDGRRNGEREEEWREGGMDGRRNGEREEWRGGMERGREQVREKVEKESQGDCFTTK